jgi:hypothetical protein
MFCESDRPSTVYFSGVVAGITAMDLIVGLGTTTFGPLAHEASITAATSVSNMRIINTSPQSDFGE